jgi:cytoskeleton protein RodZ
MPKEIFLLYVKGGSSITCKTSGSINVERDSDPLQHLRQIFVEWLRSSYRGVTGEDGVVESPVGEQLKQIADRLKQAREDKGIALEEIASQTYIPLRLLKAMDEGKFERLPEPVFIQGFIRRYGDAIGLDGSDLAKSFVVEPPPFRKPAEEFLSKDTEDEANAPAPVRNPRAANFQVPEPAAPEPPLALPAPKVEEKITLPEPEPPSNVIPAGPIFTEDPTPTPSQWEGRSGSGSSSGGKGLYWFFGLLALGLIGLAAWLINQPKPAPNGNSSSSSTIAPASNQPAPATSPSNAASPMPAGSVNVKVNVTDNSWMQVEVDGKQVMEGELPKGTQRTWSGKEVKLYTGNGQGISYSYNNSPFKPMSPSADPAELSFPPQP